MRDKLRTLVKIAFLAPVFCYALWGVVTVARELAGPVAVLVVLAIASCTLVALALRDWSRVES